MTNSRQRRGWARFSITSLLLLTAVVGLGIAWQRAKQEHAQTVMQYADELQVARVLREEAEQRYSDLVDATTQKQIEAGMLGYPRGRDLRNEGKWHEAIPVFERALEVETKYLGASHRQTMRTQLSVGEMYSLADRPDAAEPHLVKFVEYARAEGEGNQTLLSSALSHLAGVYRRQGRYLEAEKLYRERIAFKKQQDPDHWTLPNALSNLGACLLEQGQLKEAEPLLVAGFEGLEAKSEKIWLPQRRRNISRAAERLVALYEKLERPEEVKKWQAELERVLEQYPPPPP